MTRLLCMRLGAGQSSATLEILHIVRRVTPYLRRTSGLGGWLTEQYNWRWVFYINIPFGLLAASGLIAFLEETPHSALVRLDWTGFASLSIGIGALQMLLDRGETLDWFSSREIQIEALLAGLGFYIFLMQSVLAPKPFLSPRLFKDLTFSSSIAIIFVFGLILFTTMALLAPYLQILLNYPVQTAGLIMAPRGAGAMLSALVCGRIMRWVSPAVLIGIGFIGCIYALYAMIAWTPDISEWTIARVGFIQGLGTSCISVPLATIAFTTLAPQLRSEATGVFSLMRNLGSSIGISVTAALLDHNTQVNHAIIGAAVTPFNRFLQTGTPLTFWNPASAQGAAMLNSVITRQSNIIAYIDDFKLMLLLTALATPLALLIRISRNVSSNDASTK